MKQLLKTLGLAAIVTTTVACTDKIETPKGHGEVIVSAISSPKVSLKNVTSGDKVYTIEGVTLPTSDNLSLEIISDEDNSKQSWATITEFGSEKRYFTEGVYTIKVAHGDSTIEGYDIAPYFYGEKKISVTARQVTKAEISACIGHSLVNVECTEKFNSYFTSAEFKISTLAGGEFEVTLPMTKNLFICPQQFAITCTAVKQTGEEIALPKQIFTEVNPQTRYTVKFDVAEAGGATIQISLNDTIVGNVTIETELNDDALPE